MSSQSPTSPTKRLACDRCHSKKIKCQVQNNKICQRCQRQGLSCNFSPPAKTGRPANSKVRRTNTAPSPSVIRHRNSPSFSSVVSSTQSLSPSPGNMPPAAPRTPCLDTSLQPAPIFTSPSDYAYPFFDGPVVVEPQSLVPLHYDAQDYFPERTSSLLTPISYEGSCSPMTTMSSLSMPYLPMLGPESTSFDVEMASQPMNVDMPGFALGQTMSDLAALERSLPSRVIGHGMNVRQRTETLLQASERICSLLHPCFEFSSHCPCPAQSFDVSTLGFAIGVFGRVVESYEAAITQSATGQMPDLSADASPPTRAVTPSALSIHSPAPSQLSPLLQPGSGPTALVPTSIPRSHSRSMSSPMQLSTSNLSPAPHGASPMVEFGLPPVGPVSLGDYQSRDSNLSRWILANTLLYHVRNLSQLHKRMDICLSFCAPQEVAHSLNDLGNRICTITSQTQCMIQQLSDDR